MSEANRSMALSVRANGAVAGFMVINSHFWTPVHSTLSTVTTLTPSYVHWRYTFLWDGLWRIVYVRWLLVRGALASAVEEVV